MKATAVVGLLLLAGAGVVAAQGSPPGQGASLTLGGALRLALERNLSVARNRAEIGASRAQRDLAVSLVLPRVGVNGSYVRNSQEVMFGSGEDSRTILPRDDWNYRVSLSQPIFAGLRDRKAYAQAKLGMKNATEGVRAAEDEVLLGVALNYLGTVAAEKLIEVEAENLALADRRRRLAQDFYEVGEATQVEVLRADAAMKSAERRLVEARQRRGMALSELRINLALDSDIRVVEPEVALPSLPDEEALVRLAESSRPDLLRAANEAEVARLEVEKQEGARWPVLTAEGGYIRQQTSFPTHEYGFAALRLQVPIFQGGEVRARVALARERARQAEFAHEEAKLRVREEVRRALLDLETARATHALAEDQLVASKAEYDQVFELYRSEEATALDVEAAESGLAEARRAVLSGRLDQTLGWVRAWFAAGSLKGAVLKEVP